MTDGGETPTDANGDPDVDLEQLVAENATEFAESLETIAYLQETGTLDDLLELVELVSLITAAMDDEMIMSVAAMGTRIGELADTAAKDDVATGLDDVLAALGEATDEQPEKVGMVGLLKALRDPEVQAGLGVVIALARALGQNVTDRHQ